MQIITHPNNRHHIDKLEIQPALDRCEYHQIRPMGIPIVYSDLIPETTPSKTHFADVEKNRFCSYSQTCPKDWEVYFGFVKPVLVPHFIMMHDHKTRVTHEVWRSLECSSNLPTTLFAKEQKTPVRPSVSSLTQEVLKRQLLQLDGITKGRGILSQGHT